MLDSEQKKNIADSLEQKIDGLTCPMCQSKNFIMADGYFNNNMQTDFSSISFGGPSIPTIAIICTNCGFISQHALGVLGLLPKEEKTQKNESTK